MERFSTAVICACACLVLAAGCKAKGSGEAAEKNSHFERYVNTNAQNQSQTNAALVNVAF